MIHLWLQKITYGTNPGQLVGNPPGVDLLLVDSAAVLWCYTQGWYSETIRERHAHPSCNAWTICWASTNVSSHWIGGKSFKHRKSDWTQWWLCFTSFSLIYLKTRFGMIRQVEPSAYNIWFQLADPKTILLETKRSFFVVFFDRKICGFEDHAFFETNTQWQ